MKKSLAHTLSFFSFLWNSKNKVRTQISCFGSAFSNFQAFFLHSFFSCFGATRFIYFCLEIYITKWTHLTVFKIFQCYVLNCSQFLNINNYNNNMDITPNNNLPACSHIQDDGAGFTTAQVIFRVYIMPATYFFGICGNLCNIYVFSHKQVWILSKRFDSRYFPEAR